MIIPNIIIRIFIPNEKQNIKNSLVIMNIYDLSRKICIEQILSYKIKPRKDYSYGGFYLIKNIVSGKCYVGKSIDYMARLKQHTFKSKSKTMIDAALKNEGFENFEFYLLATYQELDINFFNRKLETVIEHRLITKYKSNYPIGYNERHYGHI